MNRERTAKLPPSSWFQSYRPEGSNVVVIGMSEEFRDLGNAEVGRCMNQWINYTRILSTQTAFSSEERRISQDVIKEAEDQISKITGFRPQEIWDRAVILRKQRERTHKLHSNSKKPK